MLHPLDPPLRPHVVQLGAPIVHITPLPGGGYAIGTRKNVQLVDAQLVPGPVLAGYGEVVALTDSRLVLKSTPVRVGTPSALDSVDVGKYCRDVLPTADGFIAVGSDRIVIDRAGVHSTVKFPEACYPYVARWRDGIAIADESGLRLVGPTGSEVARSDKHDLIGTPCVIGAWIIVPGLKGLLHVFDASAQLVSTLKGNVLDVRPFAHGIVNAPKDMDDSLLEYFEVGDDSVLAKRWSITADGIRGVQVVGERLAITVGECVWIVDASGDVLARIEDLSFVNAIAAFEDGIVVCGRRTVWWRPGSGEIELPHDGLQGHACTVPVGLATADNDALLIWRTDVQGPPPVPLQTDLPFDTPIVVDGVPMTVLGTKRFTIEVRNRGKVYSRSPAYEAWRHQTTRDEAVPLLERLIARTFDGPLPTEGTSHQIAQLPLAQTVDLIGRGLFAIASLDREVADLAAHARTAFFEELALALGTRPRLLLAAIRARKLELHPPRAVTGYDYLGTFTTSGNLIIADPCYLGQKSDAFPLALTHKVTATEGTWVERGARHGPWERVRRVCERSRHGHRCRRGARGCV